MAAGSPGAKRRARQHPDERRKQLIGIGLEMLTTRPLHQITIDDVAAKAGISRSLLFHYFPTKRDYYADVVRAASRRLLRATRVEGDTIDDLVAGFLNFIERRHEPYIALFRSAGTDDWAHEIFRETRAALTDQVLTALAIEQPSELVRAAVGAWLAYAEELALEWAQHHTGTREQVHALLTGALEHIVRSAR
ncbi:TetR/AcrR family transcriptional regulator [Haloechinothrix halophila]|uniref:TetR/AcrR family transcriptional regulator n=1 Tax=Haloechinothrix halophila TaxID=1069073 RepID=UPI000412E1A1|nr:TetR/AcrR family transcriptional regulator [Haloechinothrix halophila]